MASKKTIAPVQKPLSLKDFHKKRNRLLIWHDKGGLGDVFMQRMIFNDFKKAATGMDIVFACLPEYLDAAKDHPDIAEVVDSRNVNLNDYCLHYNTCVSVADRYENQQAPNCKEHRADIWAKYCGLELTQHDMMFNLDPELTQKCRSRLETYKTNDGPIVLFCPVSKMATKSLLPNQIETVQDNTKGCNLVTLHNKVLPNLPGVYDATILEWMHYIAAADYMISVDTAAFHMAGGLKKPLVGIFTFADGKVYGKHFDFILVQKHRDNGNWDCGPCFTFANCPKCPKNIKPCLTEISREELTTGIWHMFNRWPWKNERIPLV